MGIRLIALPLAWALVAVALGACAPTPPATPSPSAVVTPGPSPSPSPSILAGATSLAISGRVTSYCIPPPSGCGYWVTLVLPGGETMRSELQYAPEWDPAKVTLTPGAGLPLSLPRGQYALVFEFAEFSDVASFTTGPDGALLPYPPVPEVGCTAMLVIEEQPRATVVVTYDGWSCKVRITP